MSTNAEFADMIVEVLRNIGKPGYDYTDINECLTKEADSTKKVDMIFDALKPLDSDIYLRIIDVLEENRAGNFPTSREESKRALEELKTRKQNLFFISPEEMEETLQILQADLQIWIYIIQAKGDTAHPFTKAVMEELSNLTDQEYNSLISINDAIYRAAVAVSGVMLEEEPKLTDYKPNPFRILKQENIEAQKVAATRALAEQQRQQLKQNKPKFTLKPRQP